MNKCNKTDSVNSVDFTSIAIYASFKVMSIGETLIFIFQKP